MPLFLCPKKLVFRFCHILCEYSGCHSTKLFFCFDGKSVVVDILDRPSKLRYQILLHT